MKQRAKRLLKRYLPAEIGGTLFALTLASVSFHLTGNDGLTATTSSVSESIGYYAIMLVCDVDSTRRNYKNTNHMGGKE